MLDIHVSSLPTLAHQISPLGAGPGALRLAKLAGGPAGATPLPTAPVPLDPPVRMALLPDVTLPALPALTELAIAAGCLSVGAALIVLERKGDIKRPGICVLMAAMVILVGLYHGMNSIGPVPYLLTALLAIATMTMGTLFWLNLPAMIEGPGPQRFAEAHATLQKEFDRRMTVKEDLRQAHEALQAAHSDLERRVVERTAALRLIDLALPLLEAGQSLRFAVMPEALDNRGWRKWAMPFRRKDRYRRAVFHAWR